MMQMQRIAMLLLLSLTGCTHYAGIAAAPNGVIWVAMNSGGGQWGPESKGIYACIVRGTRLECMRMETTGLP